MYINLQRYMIREMLCVRVCVCGKEKDVCVLTNSDIMIYQQYHLWVSIRRKLKVQSRDAMCGNGESNETMYAMRRL